jgi:TATA-binding protein-associated factor Taf7
MCIKLNAEENIQNSIFCLLLNKSKEYLSKFSLICWRLVKNKVFLKKEKREKVKYVEYEVHKIMRRFS